MRAAVMRAVGQLLSIEDVPVPQIGPDEVLVETRACGICGTDLHILEGRGYVPALPHILGHEPAGVVAQVGADVSGLQAGDRVVPHLFFSCDRCYFCRLGRHQQCLNLKGILGVLCPGAFAEFFKAPAANLFPLPSSVPFSVGGLVADAVVTALHATKRAGIELRDSALVLGAGGVGQILIQILHAQGIPVAAIDRSEEKLRLAEKMGASLALLADDPDILSAVHHFSGTEGVSCVFNCVGTGSSMRLAADCVRRCGRVVVIGEEADHISLGTTEIAQRELEIIGSRNGTRQDTVEAIRLVASGVIKPFIAEQFPLEKINDAFDCMRKGALARLVIVVRE
ncbi:MAG: alcohol dehydrogenase catalytic domain-containing protein [Acidobacteria bacterium]|nr:alcohol dehydrogenase catalytic domain-containing protein [Acidobacteriota bacterium]